MGRFPKYKLTDKQIRGIACIVAHEQGTIAGWYAEASQIANRTDIKGDEYATAANAVKTVCSGWYAHGKTRYNKGTSNKTVIEIVKRVFCDGYRTLPRYIDEHDCMSDIASAKNGSVNVRGDKSKWVRHKTIIRNKMKSTYLFYDFPGGYKTGVDPFGYTSSKNREKWGDFCYTVEQAQKKADDKVTEEKKATVSKTDSEEVAVPKGADRVIAVAKAEVGYLEKKSNKDLSSKTANVGRANYTKYGKWIGANGDYWCASFISWCFCKAYGSALGKKLLCGAYSAACETIRQNFIKKKQYHTFLTGARPGDVIFFKGTRHSGANHIGLIYKVADGKVYTIEGNTSGASGVVDNGGGVAKKSYKTTDTHVLGYGRPDYSLVGASESTRTDEKPSNADKGISYYPKCKNSTTSLVDALKSVSVKDTSLRARQIIAEKNGIKNYSGKADQNVKLLELLKAGKLIKP